MDYQTVIEEVLKDFDNMLMKHNPAFAGSIAKLESMLEDIKSKVVVVEVEE